MDILKVFDELFEVKLKQRLTFCSALIVWVWSFSVRASGGGSGFP